jgi:hypothetical protein
MAGLVDGLEVPSYAGGAEGEASQPSFNSLYYPPDTSVWPHTSSSYLTTPSTDAPEVVALNYLRNNASKFGLKAADFDQMQITDQYTSAAMGVTHVYFRQMYRGLPIENALANVNVNSDGSVLNADVMFVPNLSTTQNQPIPNPVFTAPAAYTKFAGESGLPLSTAIVPIAISGKLNQQQTFSSGGLGSDPIDAELRYVATKDGMQLAWSFDVKYLQDAHWYYASVNAMDGSTLKSIDMVSSFGTYNVYQLPVDNPQEGNRSVAVNPDDSVASPYGWHDTNGLPGPEFTDTRGNNVFVQEDRDGDTYANTVPVALGARPDGGPSLVFNYPVDLTQPLLTNENAALTNYFYSINRNHDVYYHYGFDEAAGNFQSKNYTGLGQGNDQVIAFAEVPMSVNAAGPYFVPTPDGQSPVLVMTDNTGFATTTPPRDGAFDNTIIAHEYAHGLTERLTGGPSSMLLRSTLQGSSLSEGWSDFFSLMLNQDATDQANDAVPIGNWFMGLPATGPGIRNYPYSYDMTINPATIGIFNLAANQTDFYLAGQAWASALWDMNWLLINKYGYDSNIATGTGGNNLTLQLAIDGLKLQSAAPSLVEARDAILAADYRLTGGVNQKEIWTAFARRGLGYLASDGGSSSSQTITEDFSMPPSPGIVTGQVWLDSNGNGLKDSGEQGLTGRKVFIDIDADGVRDPLEPRVLTDASGGYQFDFYVSGSFTIGVEDGTGEAQTFPANGADHTVTVTTGRTVSGVDFGVRTDATRSYGVKFNDLDHDGRRDANEPGIAGVWIYVDLDNDGRIDLGEPKAQTGADGTYQLALTTPGTFMIREAVPAGWEQTLPGGSTQAYAVTISSGTLNLSLDFGNAKLDDFSDAPASYGVISHPILPGLNLGAAVDGEVAAAVSANADGDDLNKTTNDDDGIKFNSTVYPGAHVTYDVIATTSYSSTVTGSTTPTTITNGAGRLNAWVDFNRNGTFEDSEKVASDLKLLGGVHSLAFDVPANATPGLTMARFRYGYTRNQTPTGSDIAGEVEDYQIRILGATPDAVDDVFSVPQNSNSTRLNVLANDITSYNGPIKVTSATSPSQGGTVIVAADGSSVSYKPLRGWFGTDTFKYTIEDQNGVPDEATVTVNVLPNFANPIAADDSFDVPEDSVDNSLDVLKNDFAGQRPPIEIVEVLNPIYGTAVLDDKGTSSPSDDVILYTPAAGAGVTDQFQYIIQDANGVQDTATVTVHVKPGADLDDDVAYRLEATDLNGAPISTIGVGQKFLLNVYVQDIRPTPPDEDLMGVFAGYLDVIYDYAKVSVSGSVVHGSEYQNFVSAGTGLPGLVDEAGGFQTNSDPLGSGEILLLAVPMTANSIGKVDFVGDPADIPTEHDTLLYEPPEAVSLQGVRYINASLTIVSGSAPLAVDDTFDVEPGVNKFSLKVLANDLANSPVGTMTVTGVRSVGATEGTIEVGPSGADVLYTVGSGFEGTEQFTYTMRNADGMESSATLTVQVGDADKSVQLRLATTDLSGGTITSVQQGEQFQLRVYVQDVRAAAADRGVFAAYLDVLYDSLLVSTSPDTTPGSTFDFQVQFGPEYTNFLSGSDAVPNLINELGAFQTSGAPLGSGEFLLAAITFDADRVGTARFAADPADLSPTHDVLTYEPVEAVDLSVINLGSTSITILSSGSGEAGLTNPRNANDVNNDGTVSPVDALFVINAINKFGAANLVGWSWSEGEAAGAGKTPAMGYLDVTGDGFLSPADALCIINALNGEKANAEGESVASAWYAVNPTSDAEGESALPLNSTPAQLSVAEVPTSAYLTANRTDAALQSWEAQSDPASAKTSSDFAAAIDEIWGDLGRA